MSFKREVKALIKRLEKEGWEITICRGSNHYKAVHPKVKGSVTISHSPSCRHWEENCLSDIKRINAMNEGTNL